MRNQKTTSSTDNPTQANAVRIALTALLAGILTVGFDLYLLSISSAWQLYVLTALAATFTVVTLVASALIRSGRTPAIWAIVIAGQIAFIGASSLISGLGLISLVSIFSLTILIGSIAMPPARSRAAILLGFFMGSLAWLFDWIRPTFQLPAPAGLKYFIPILLIIVSIVYGIILARNFRYYPLRFQIITSMVIVSSISIGIVTMLSNANTRRLLDENANANLTSAARQTAQQVDSFIQTNLDAITAEARLPAFAALLKLSPANRANSEAESNAMQSLLALAQKDPKHISSYGLLDLAGNDIADTVRNEIGENKGTRDYYYHVLETSESYVSPVEISRSTNEPSIFFSAPVWGESGNLLGVLRLRYRATILQQIVESTRNLAGPGSYGFLIDEYHVRLAHAGDSSLVFTSLSSLDQDVWRHLVEARRLPMVSRQEIAGDLPGLVEAVEMADPERLYTGPGTNANVEQSAIVALNSRPWKLVFSIDTALLTAPVENQTRSNALLALAIAGLAAAGGLFLARLLTTPITQLTQAARNIATGDLNAQVPVISGSEIGLLAAAFNAMTTQLRMTLEGLEERVTERTTEIERRAMQLRAAAEVGSAVASVRVLDELLPRITQLISERFGYYHVGIFLLDPTSEYAILRAANSSGGQRMLERGHRLKVGSVGIVGYAAAHREPRLALDVGQDEVYYKNPDLPETRSELALPLLAGGRVLGALDVQSDQPAAFSTDVIATLQILADQVAIAIDNARLFSENQASIEAARRAYGEVRSEAWDRMLHARSDFGYLSNRQDEVYPSTQGWTPEMDEAAHTGNAIASEDGSLAVPIKDQERVIGVLRLKKPPEKSWSKEETELVQTVSQQLFLAVESARLFQETRARAERERLASQITAQMRSSNDPQTILQTAVSQLRHALQAQRAQVLIRPAQTSETGGTDSPDDDR